MKFYRFLHDEMGVAKVRFPESSSFGVKPVSKEGTAGKGDVLGVATTAGIMGAKRTSDLIPMCHILPITKCKVEFEMVESELAIYCNCTVRVTGKTGVEMEALTGASVALLTVYDMCKAMDKKMEIGEIYLVRKSGGKSGVVAFLEGIRAFIPASQLSADYVEDTDAWIGKDVRVVVITVDPDKWRTRKDRRV